jgi:hypothetical protein
LTFHIHATKFPDGVMKSRITAAVVCLLYLSAALIVGVVHHHHNDGPLGNHIENPLRIFDSQPYLAPPFSFSASRAPPVTPA